MRFDAARSIRGNLGWRHATRANWRAAIPLRISLHCSRCSLAAITVRTMPRSCCNVASPCSSPAARPQFRPGSIPRAPPWTAAERRHGCKDCGNSRRKANDSENSMSGFLDDMASLSTARVAEAVRHESALALERRARQAPPSAPLRLSPAGFDVIAELKLRSPAAGPLSDEGQDWLGRIAAYARGGAVAVSVLTEPSRFDGSLEHLRRAAAVLRPLGVPAMRKDFLVDPYQVLEARAAGAGGVVVILRMLTRARIVALLDVAAEHRMFVLLEAFDGADLELARELMSS